MLTLICRLSDSASTLFSDSSASSSLSSLLDLFPSPPTFKDEVRRAFPVEESYPTPPPSPLVLATEFAVSKTPSVTFMPATAPIKSTPAPRPVMSTSESDALALDRLFAPGRPTLPYKSDMAISEEPDCPSPTVFAAYKAPITKHSPIPASASFHATIEYAATGGYLTPPASPLWC